MKKYILFDLDGTLTDPKEGITKSFQYALEAYGIHEENLDALVKYIGPPLKDSFMEGYGFDETKAIAAVKKYRERFEVTGLYENIVYDGICGVLDQLVENGYQLIVATSKPEKFAKIIISHFGLEKYFIDVCGSNLDLSRDKKEDVIAYILEKHRITEREGVVMVGDRKYDVIGAKKFQIPCVGVLYGFGSEEELLEAGAAAIASKVTDLYLVITKII